MEAVSLNDASGEPVLGARALIGPPFGSELTIAVVTLEMTVGLLLIACRVKWLWATIGVVVPAEPDTVRDMESIQGFLDGNWLGNPPTAGAWRWCLPAVIGIAALVAGGLHLPLLSTWLHVGRRSIFCPR
jgi:hypothetical protein